VPAPRKYDEETRARAVRMYQERIRDLGESKLTTRRAVGAMVDINPETSPSWMEREEIDAGDRPGVSRNVSDDLKAAGERRTASGRGDPQDGVGVFRPGGARPPA
jgi:transposase